MTKECCTHNCNQGRTCPTMVRAKDYDHENVDIEFTSDGTLALIGNVLGSFIVFALLMGAIAFLAQVPDKWESWLVLSLWGL